MTAAIACRASRRGRRWVVHVPEHGVYGHGRTLAAARDSTERGLALIGITAEVALTAVTPELDALRAAEAAYTAALRTAVVSLSLRRSTLRDIAAATRVPTARIKRLLTDQAQDSPVAAAPPAHEEEPPSQG